MSISAEPKELETDVDSFCKSQKKDRDALFTTHKSISGYQKLCEDTNGLFARIIGKISALTMLQYVNYINNKTIGRIKYALN